MDHGLLLGGLHGGVVAVTLPFTSVVSLHTNEYGCGVARFSKQLAKRLGVPFKSLYQGWGEFPLLSLKFNELDQDDDLYLQERIGDRASEGLPYGVFWHDTGATLAYHAEPSVVYYADPSLGSPGLWCPSLLQPSTPRTVKLFSFGMAGRLQIDQFLNVRALLEHAGLPYHLRVSSGLHEGTSLSDAMQGFDQLQEVMGREQVTFLGILSDDALLDEIHSADYVLAFFKDGVKANNTTVHAALDAGAKVITNGSLRNAINLHGLHKWPQLSSRYSWEALMTQMALLYKAHAHV